VGGSALAYSDTGVSPGTSYSYGVRAFDAAANYSAVSSLTVTTPSGSAPTSCVPASNAFTGCYYTNTSLSGQPALIRTDPQINFDWFLTTPAPGIPATNYSVRWQGNFTFQEGTYVFSMITSDGIRLYIDGNLIFDRWRDQPIYSYQTRPWITGGSHLVTVEYYQTSGTPTAHVSWQKY
jgi:beta-glucosidase